MVRSLANSKFITESSSERLLQIGEDLRVTAMSLVAYFFERSVAYLDWQRCAAKLWVFLRSR